MNPLRRIEPEVLALGREWTRLELEKRRQEPCEAMPTECAPTGHQLKPLLESPAPRAAAHQEIIAREVNYFPEHEEHLHYNAMEDAGAPLGSGAVESLGKQLQRRLRGCGQFWGRPGLTSLLRLSVLVKNHDHPHIWN